ncbi:MAG: nucleotidyltransferase domain-containing protein [Chloroflexi bacterium]|nr:nucleotidyltransferase domain-containing protein [Chloroflexota bacterium]
MASKTERIIDRYRKELGSRGIRARAVFLFGSYAQGNQHEGSDLDLVVISEDFSQLGLLERMELLGLAAGRLKEPIQAYGFTPEEIESGALPPFLKEVLEHEAIAV